MRRALALLATAVVLLSCDENRTNPVGSSSSKPLALSARSEGYDAVLSWTTTLSGLSGFELDRSLGDSIHFLPLRFLRAMDTTWTDTFATPDLDRWYRIRAIRASETVATSDLASCRPWARPDTADTTSGWYDTLGGTPPIVRADTDSFKVVVQWREYTGPDIDGYMIERSIGDTTHFTPVALASATARRWDDTSATTPGLRWYRIRLRVGHAVSKPSNIAGNMPLLPQVTMEPRLNGTKIGTLEVPQGTTMAVVELANTGGVELEVSDILTTRAWLTASMDDSTIPVGASRLLRLDIDTALVASSGVRVATVEARTKQGATSTLLFLVLERGSDTVVRPRLRIEAVGTNSVTLTWDKLVGKLVPGVIVQRLRGTDTAFVPVDTIESIDAVTWVDRGLAGMDSLRYRMVAQNAAGDTAISNVVGTRTFPSHTMTILVRDSDGRLLQGTMVADSSHDSVAINSEGNAELRWNTRIESAWTVYVPGYLSSPFAIDTTKKQDSLSLILDPLPAVRRLAVPEGTDYRGGAFHRDTAWLVDGDATGSVLLTGSDLSSNAARTVRRILGQNLFKGSPGMVVRYGDLVATSFPFDGTVALAQVATNSVKQVQMPDSIGAPWGLASCPDGIGVAGSEGMGVFDSAGKWKGLRPLASVVDDVASLHGGRISCTSGAVFLADNGGANGLARLDRNTGVISKADLQGRTTARFLTSDSSLVVAGTMGGAAPSIHIFDHALRTKGRCDLGKDVVITGLAMVVGRGSEPFALAAYRQGTAAFLAIVDTTGLLRGTLPLEDVPVELTGSEGMVMVVYTDRAELVMF